MKERRGALNALQAASFCHKLERRSLGRVADLEPYSTNRKPQRLTAESCEYRVLIAGFVKGNGIGGTIPEQMP